MNDENPKGPKPQEHEIERYVREFQFGKDTDEAWGRFVQLDREQRENSFREFDPTGAKRAAYRRVYGKECPNLFALESGAGSRKPSRTTADELGARTAPAASSERQNETRTNIEKPAVAGRRAQIDGFIESVTRAQQKITRKDIVIVAGYNERRGLERYQAGDPKASRESIRTFDRVLNLSPAQFVVELNKKKARG